MFSAVLRAVQRNGVYLLILFWRRRCASVTLNVWMCRLCFYQ